MNWKKFAELNNIGKRFHDISLEKVFANNPLHQEAIHLFFQKPHSMILHGFPGRGKTFTTLALIRKLLEKENPYSLRFIKAKTIDDTMLEFSLEKRNPANFLRVLRETKYLFIDDFGIDKATKRVVNDLYHIIDYRWENYLPTVISTNFKEDEILEHYGERIASRLKSYKKLFFGGSDLRG